MHNTCNVVVAPGRYSKYFNLSLSIIHACFYLFIFLAGYGGREKIRRLTFNLEANNWPAASSYTN